VAIYIDSSDYIWILYVYIKGSSYLFCCTWPINTLVCLFVGSEREKDEGREKNKDKSEEFKLGRNFPLEINLLIVNIQIFF